MNYFSQAGACIPNNGHFSWADNSMLQQPALCACSCATCSFNSFGFLAWLINCSSFCQVVTMPKSPCQICTGSAAKVQHQQVLLLLVLHCCVLTVTYSPWSACMCASFARALSFLHRSYLTTRIPCESSSLGISWDARGP